MASINIEDLAVLRGVGVFETMRTYNGHVFRIDDHLNRLMNSMLISQIPYGV